MTFIHSVRIDVDQLLRDRALEAENPPLKSSRSRKADIGKDGKSRPRAKRPSEGGEEGPKAKKIKIKPSTSSGPSTSSQSQPPMKGFLPKTVTLKLGPRPTEPDTFPCCLCISMARDGLLRVHDPPIGRKDADGAAGSPKIWLAHEDCANIVPETWVDEVESDVGGGKEKVVFGVDGIVKDRWNLVRLTSGGGFLAAHWVPCRNVLLARRLALRRMVRRFNAQRASVPRPSMYLAREMAKNTVSSSIS